MPHSQLQRLRYQLAASRGEVHALEQKITQLDAASVAAAQERAVAGSVQGAAPLAKAASPRRGTRWNWLVSARDAISRRLRAVVTRGKRERAPGFTQTDSASECRPALQPQEHTLSQPEAKREVIEARAVIAQLQQDLAVQRQRALRAELRLLSHDEDKARGDLQDDVEHELEALALAFRALGTGDARPLVATQPADALCTSANTPRPRTGNAELSFPEPTSPRSPTYARECLFIDRICHWVGSFVYRDWARVCPTTARAVQQAMQQSHAVWMDMANMLGQFQSSGQGIVTDNRFFGSALGPLAAARDEVRALRDKAVRAGADKRWRDRFLVHMQVTAHLYEEMRLLHRQVYFTAACITSDRYHAIVTLEQTLEMHDARTAAAGSSQEGAPRHSASAGAES
eukprot:TRINITY_DN14029_c0_g2_i1.p1 TRINITY_DN14029_c0_g2~~TRINITY_DN14029_c0_g2_i1.p1  ORF type:complete len:417 (+),score=56.03 TRINITY_DN14029_c0_g2_i1:49-1251(+)